MTPDEAKQIVDAHDVRSITQDDEERELLAKHNPALLAAYEALLALADTP